MKRMFFAGLLVFALDQISKLVVVLWLDLKNVGEIDVFPPYLNFIMAWNRGINFGLFDTSRWILIVIALAISFWVFLWVRRETHPVAQISGGILIGGALGNVIDRLTWGAVADFLNMSCCGFENPYAFNVADIAIFAGAFGLVIFSGREKKSNSG